MFTDTHALLYYLQQVCNVPGLHVLDLKER